MKFTKKWSALARALEDDDFPVCDLDCSKYELLCDTFTIDKYPTFWWVEEDDIKEELEGHQKLRILIGTAQEHLKK